MSANGLRISEFLGTALNISAIREEIHIHIKINENGKKIRCQFISYS